MDLFRIFLLFLVNIVPAVVVFGDQYDSNDLVQLVGVKGGGEIDSGKEFRREKKRVFTNADTPVLFGFGFAKDGTLDVSILTSLQNEAADPSVFLTTEQVEIERTLMYLYVCDYSRYDTAVVEILREQRKERSASLCLSRFYHTFDEQQCLSVPLVYNSLAPYSASTTFSAKIVVPGVYVGLVTNCELKGVGRCYPRSCSSFLTEPANCTEYPPYTDTTISTHIKYTMKNPFGFLSTTERPFITIYMFWTITWSIVVVAWILNTAIHRFKNGILLQWHLTLCLVLKIFSSTLNWDYYVSTNQGKSTSPLLNVILSILCECALYEILIRVAKGWMITVRKFHRLDVVRTYLPVAVFFSAKLVYQLFYDSQFPVLDPREEDVDQIVIVFSLFANGGAYFFILLTVWSSSLQWSRRLHNTLCHMEEVGMQTEGTATYYKLQMFVYFRFAFLGWLVLTVIAWFVRITVLGRTGDIYFPWVIGAIGDSLEFLFICGVLFTFRARKFNIIQQDLDVINAVMGNVVVPAPHGADSQQDREPLEETRGDVIILDADGNPYSIGKRFTGRNALPDKQTGIES
jgi:hypothetical protein